MNEKRIIVGDSHGLKESLTVADAVEIIKVMKLVTTKCVKIEERIEAIAKRIDILENKNA